MFPGLFPLFCALVFTGVPHDVEARREVLLTPTDADDEASETEEVAKSFGECWVLWLDKHLGPTSAEPDAETLLQINRDCSAANHQDVLTALFGLRRTWARRSWQCGDCDAKCLTDVCAHVRGIVAVDDDEVPVVGGSATGIAVDDDEVPVVGGSATGIAVDDDEVPVMGGSATGIAMDVDEVPVVGGSATGIAVDDDEDLPIHGVQQKLVMDVSQDQAEDARMKIEFMEMVFIDYRQDKKSGFRAFVMKEFDHGTYVEFTLDMQFTKQGFSAGLQKMQDSYAWKDFSHSFAMVPAELIESEVMVPAEWIEPENPFDEFGAENPFDEFGAEEGTPDDMSDETDEDLVALGAGYLLSLEEERLEEEGQGDVVAFLDGMSEEDLKELLKQDTFSAKNPFDEFGAENPFDEFGAEVSPEPPVEYKPIPDKSSLA